MEVQAHHQTEEVKAKDNDLSSKPKIKPVFVGVSGGTASGKTTVCEVIFEKLGLNDCTLISLDSFYKGLTEEEKENASEYNFDHPNALDFDLAYKVLSDIVEGREVMIPRYNFVTHSREAEWEKVNTTNLIIFEGILALYDKRIRDMMDLMIFVNTDDDIRLARRLLRDTQKRGRTIESVLFQYNKFVKKAYDEYIKPTMNYADIIVPKGGENTVAIQFIVENLKLQLRRMEHKQGINKDKGLYDHHKEDNEFRPLSFD